MHGNSTRDTAAFLKGGGEAGALIRAYDWSSTPLGPMSAWPQSLMTAVGIVVRSRVPIVMLWGPEGVMIYNDAYSAFAGGRHPDQLGSNVRDGWPEVADFNDNVMKVCLAGGTLAYKDQELTLNRTGAPEPVWMDLDYSPIPGEDGEPAGVLAVVVETTQKVLEERRRAFMLALSDALRASDDPTALIATSCEMLGRHLGAERCGFGEPDPEGVHFTNEADWTGVDMPSLAGVQRMADFGQEVFDELRAGRSLRIDDTYLDPRTAPYVAGYRKAGELRSALTVPLIVDGGLSACVFVNQSTPRRWAPDKESLVRDVAGRIFTTLQRRRAEHALASGSDQLKAALDATRASQSRLSMAMGIARLGTFEWDTVSGAVEMDAQGREIFGLSADGPVHQGEVFARLAKIDVERAQGLTQAAAVDGSRVEADYRVTRLDGTTRRVLSASEPLTDEAGHLRMVGVFHDVTALRQAEANLRALNADLERQVIERIQARGRTWQLTPDLMGALNAEGFFETSNPAWQTMLGWSENDVADMPIWELLHPDDVERTRAAFGLTQVGQSAVRFLNRFRRKDGPYRWISWIGVPEDGRVYCTGRDITVEREREEALASRTAERDLLATIVQSDHAPICAFDTEYRLIAFNRAHSDEFHRIFDYRVQVGDVFPDLFPADQAAVMRSLMARALTGEVFTVVEEFGDPALVKPYWEVSYSPLRDEAGQIFGAFHHAQDITNRLRAEAELRQAQDALRQAQKMEAVGQLTGGVAHDFNNLLTVIKSSTDLLKRPDLPEARRTRYVAAIADTVDRAAKLTGQLLAFARRQALKPEVFAACESVRGLTDMMGTLTGSRIRVVTELPDWPCHVNADPSQFDTALVNMAVNARDAMGGEGQLTVRVIPVEAMPAVRAHPAVKGTFVAVSISDTGSGIPAERLEVIFEPFFTTKGVGQGTGLGLSQVFGFAKQSGGEVTVASVVGCGTTFTLYLPRVSGEGRTAGSEPEPLTDGHGTCVLVVEDNVEVGTFAVQTLADLGYVTVLATNAEEALSELATDADRFDVVFSDVVMPGMNGIDLAHRIRDEHHDLPVLLASGYSHVLAQNGTYGFELLHKPYSVEDLSRLLRKVATWQRRKRIMAL